MTTLAQEFETRVRALDQRARAAGTNMTTVCKATGLARITYERWVQRAPQSLHKLDELEAEVARAERQQQEQAALAAD